MAAVSGPGPGLTPGTASQVPAAMPAQLGFLTIYNPSLGTTDDTMEDQIVYYSSHSPSRKKKTKEELREERNERLRQIGLAQGMVEFGRSFSGDKPVDTIETERSRVVLRELEPGWWILASIDLTRLPLPAPKSTASTPTPSSTSSAKSKPPAEAEPPFEFSSREVKPAPLLLQDLLRAHSIFLLHHASSLSALYIRLHRPRFTALLSRYWDLFLGSWNVMLHGNPLCRVFGGIKIAAGGELGFGVGEEERGSGEREVLEGLVGRVEGLVDVVVGRFGDDEESRGRWLGTGSEPGAEDGAIFLGVGALSRTSVRNVAAWMEDLYMWGENAYGVRESPTAVRERRRKKRAAVKGGKMGTSAAASAAASAAVSPPAASAAKAPNMSTTQQQPEGSSIPEFGPPPPIVRPAVPKPGSTETAPPKEDDNTAGGMDKMVGYLKLGYGTYWSLGTSSSDPADKATAAATEDDMPIRRPSASRDDAAGHYLIGLMGPVEETSTTTTNSSPPSSSEDAVPTEEDRNNNNSRTLLRTLTVELESEASDKPESQLSRDMGSNDTELASPPPPPTCSSSHGTDKSPTPTPAAGGPGQRHQTTFDSQDRNKTKKVRVVVYVNRPFIFTFLFDLRTDSLNWDTAYRSLHYQLAPLRKPLLVSTAYRPGRPLDAGAGEGGGIYDLVWDPEMMTVHSTIPNIPLPGGKGERDAGWSRVEGMNTHVQLLGVFTATRGEEVELERTAKTSRGWWIVWSRVLERGVLAVAKEEGEGEGERSASDEEEEEVTPTREEMAVVGKEIFLIRKSGERSAGGGGVGGGVASFVGGGGGGGWADGASRLAQGIGVDTRRYIEGLLSLNR